MRFYSFADLAHPKSRREFSKGQIMDLKRIAALLEQRRAGHTLPRGLYTEPNSFDFDMAAIYGQSWLMAGMDCELPKAGSYVSMMVEIGRAHD